MAQVIISSVSQQEDRVTCNGTVDGVAVSCVASAYQLSTLPDDAARQFSIAEQLINNLPPPVINRKELVTPAPLVVGTDTAAVTGKMVAVPAPLVEPVPEPVTLGRVSLG